MNTVDDQFVKKLKEHPDLEPRLEFKGELKHRLKTKAQSMQKKETFYRFAKLGSVIVVAAGLLLGAFTETGSDMLRSGYYFIVGDDSAPVGDNQEEEKGKESTGILESFLVDLKSDLIKKDVSEKAAESLVNYLQAVYEEGVERVHSLSGWKETEAYQHTALVNHYKQNIDLSDYRFHITRDDQDATTIEIIFGSESNDGIYNKAVFTIVNEEGIYNTFDFFYSITNGYTMDEEALEEAYEIFQEVRLNPNRSFSLDPVPFVQLYFYVEQLRDFDTLYDLHVLDEEKYSFPSREQFIEEGENAPDSHLFSSRLEEELEYMYQVCFDEQCNEVGVRLVMKDEESPLLFRLVSENGLWKADWLPLQ